MSQGSGESIVRLVLLAFGLLMGLTAIAGPSDPASGLKKSGSQLEGQSANPRPWNPDSRPPAAVLEHAKSLRPGLALEYLGSRNTRSNDLVWSEYSYNTPTNAHNWPAGVLHVLWSLTSSAPVWSMDWDGDFQPHSHAWIDFDGDGQRDLFFFAGFEDVFATHIYLWRLQKPGYRKDALVKVYSNDNDYSVILDMEADGRPEILDSGYSGDTHVAHQCGTEEWDRPEVPDSVERALDAKYRALSRGFDQFNFTYNMPDAYPATSMKILDPIKILRIERSGVVDVTARYPAHLRWRLGVLRDIRAVNTGKCRDLVDSVISYLEKRLTQARPSGAVRPASDGEGGRRR